MQDFQVELDGSCRPFLEELNSICLSTCSCSKPGDSPIKVIKF